MGFWSSIFGGKKKPARPTPAAARPLPQAPSKPLIDVGSGLYVFPGFEYERLEARLNVHGDRPVPGSEAPYQFPWSSIKKDDRHMAYGEDGTYDDADPETAQRRAADMLAYNSAFVVIQNQWSHAQSHPELLPSYRAKLDSPLLMGHAAMNHPIDSPVQFCVSNWDVMADANDGPNYWTEMKALGWTAATLEKSWRMYANLVATQLIMPRRNWFHILNRPVMYQGRVETLSSYKREFGVEPRQIMEWQTEEISRITGKLPYWVATSVARPARPGLRALGFDAITEYLLHGSGGWDSHAAVYRWAWNDTLALCKEWGLRYIVPASCGFDARAWGAGTPGNDQPTEIAIPTGPQYEAHLREARQIARDNPDICLPYTNTYADGENGEGGIWRAMRPKQLHNADEIMRAHKAACS